MHPVAYFEGTYESIEVEVALQFVDTYSETIVSFVNNVRTSDGGSHETGFKSALTRAFNDYAKKFSLLGKIQALDGSDIRAGMTAVVSVRITENLLEFEGQTKGKLGTPLAKTAVDAVLYR